uniref:OBP6 n=1 Tax=Episyrphus balteatus TaxID=286459 RepID=A0A6H0D3C0_EPIBA|nr:OBP6 [Episyrphus balteatus]
MKKYTIVFFVVLINTLSNAATVPDRDALLKFVRAAIDDCYEDDAKTIKVEATGAAFESLITSDPNPPRATKCMRFCVMKSHNLYNEDNTLNIKQVQELFKHVYPEIMDETKLNIVGETTEQCVSHSATVEDRCEKSHDIAMCMITKLAQRGIDIKQI